MDRTATIESANDALSSLAAKMQTVFSGLLMANPTAIAAHREVYLPILSECLGLVDIADTLCFSGTDALHPGHANGASFLKFVRAQLGEVVDILEAGGSLNLAAMKIYMHESGLAQLTTDPTHAVIASLTSSTRDWLARDTLVGLVTHGLDIDSLAADASLAALVAFRNGEDPVNWETRPLGEWSQAIPAVLETGNIELLDRAMTWYGNPAERYDVMLLVGLTEGLTLAARETLQRLAPEWIGTCRDLVNASSSLSTQPGAIC